MLEQIVDLHIHSKYSRACSPLLDLPNIARVCSEKGIDIVSTGDFTHPLWFKHLEENLEETAAGIYILKNQENKKSRNQAIRFILGTEISCIYSHKEKTRRLHLLIFAPNLAVVEKFNATLRERGVNLNADGRPIMGLSGKEIVKICLSVDERMQVVPAHAWTPWFAVFGSKSGYDSLEECFEELTPRIKAMETGLSSDPPMNHRLSQLDNIALISNSDAHSLDNLGREANVLAFGAESEIAYDVLWENIYSHNPKKFLRTIEFYPEEGKYHYDGHADCKVVLTPSESKRAKLHCPTCKKPLTIGVLHRVDALADRAEKDTPVGKFVPHRYIVPLREIIAGCFAVGVKSKRVEKEYRGLITALGSEFYILLHCPIQKIEQATSDKSIAFGVSNMRDGAVTVRPGYDGIFGVVDVFSGKKYGRPRQAPLL